jgi:hypothetical protein
LLLLVAHAAASSATAATSAASLAGRHCFLPVDVGMSLPPWPDPGWLIQVE